jgi:hypothetical protein
MSFVYFHNIIFFAGITITQRRPCLEHGNLIGILEETGSGGIKHSQRVWNKGKVALYKQNGGNKKR